MEPLSRSNTYFENFWRVLRPFVSWSSISCLRGLLWTASACAPSWPALGDDAPNHRFLHVLDSNTAASLPEDTLRMCLLPPELAPNGFLLFRVPWNLDYYYAFSNSDNETQDVEIGWPCARHSVAKRAVAFFNNNASVVHYNGLIPKQKYTAVDRQELWFLKLPKNIGATTLLDATCSASHVSPYRVKYLSR